LILVAGCWWPVAIKGIDKVLTGGIYIENRARDMDKSKKDLRGRVKTRRDYQPQNIYKDFMPLLGLGWCIFNIFYLSKKDDA